MRDQSNFFSTFFSSPINCAATAVVLGFAFYGIYHFIQERRKKQTITQTAQHPSQPDIASATTQLHIHTDKSKKQSRDTASQTSPSELTTENLEGTGNAQHFFGRKSTATSEFSDVGHDFPAEPNEQQPTVLTKKGTDIYRSPTPSMRTI